MSRLYSRLARTLDLAAFVFGLAFLYIAAEHTVYWWDYGVYQDIATTTAASFAGSSGAGFSSLWASLSQDYTELFAVPLMPALWLFGTSRLVFIEAMALLFLLPLTLVLGKLAARLVPEAAASAFWTAVLVAVLTPAAWLPILRGFPDAAAALLVALALLAQLRPEDPLRSLRSGAWLALAMLVRRHFLLALPPLAVAIVLVSVLYPGAARRRWLGALREGLLLSLGALLVLSTLGYPFVHRVVTRDFGQLYAAYENPPAVVAGNILARYGWLTCGLAVLGFVLAARRRLADARATLLVGTFTAGMLAAWCLYVRQLGEQYMYHFLPFVVLGFILLWTAARSYGPRAEQCARILGSLLLATNMLLGLADLPIAYDSFAGRDLFAGNQAPLYRYDIDALQRMVRRLRELVPPETPVAVVASSPILNWSIVRGVDQGVRNAGDAPLDIPRIAEVDSRDRYPLGLLLKAGAAVVAEPLQLHLSSESQLTMVAAHTLLTEATPLAADYERLPETYELDHGVRAVIFKRVRISSAATGLDALQRIRRIVPERPGSEPDWEVLSSVFPFWVSRLLPDATDLVAHPNRRGDEPATRAVYQSPIVAPRVSGVLTFTDQRCQGVALRFGSLRDDATLEERVSLVRRPGEPGEFDLRVPLSAGESLAFELTLPEGPPALDFCLVKLSPLRVGP